MTQYKFPCLLGDSDPEGSISKNHRIMLVLKKTSNKTLVLVQYLYLPKSRLAYGCGTAEDLHV